MPALCAGMPTAPKFDADKVSTHARGFPCRQAQDQAVASRRWLLSPGLCVVQGACSSACHWNMTPFSRHAKENRWQHTCDAVRSCGQVAGSARRPRDRAQLLPLGHLLLRQRAPLHADAQHVREPAGRGPRAWTPASCRFFSRAPLARTPAPAPGIAQASNDNPP